MPRVIGQDPGAIKRITHKACGNIIEYVENDVITLWSGTDYADSYGAKGFICPGCGEQVITERW